MKRRDTLKTAGGIGLASLLGIGASGTATANDDDEQQNPGTVGRYRGKKTFVPPDLGGFDHVLLYLADGFSDPDWNGVEQAEFFQREIMDRTTDEIVEFRNEAIDFYRVRFGLDFPEATADTVFDTVDTQSGIDATLGPSMLDPSRGYTAYVISGKAMPNTHGDGTTNIDPNVTGHVRDGSFGVTINEAATLGGTYGDGGPSDVPAGAVVTYGDYNIRMGDNEDPIVIKFVSERPIVFDDRVPSAFNCDLFHEEWGEGQVHGTTGGTTGLGIRNVITFPPSLEE